MWKVYIRAWGGNPRTLVGEWATFSEANEISRFLTLHGVVCSTEAM